jgi:hypothetical protein
MRAGARPEIMRPEIMRFEDTGARPSGKPAAARRPPGLPRPGGAKELQNDRAAEAMVRLAIT